MKLNEWKLGDHINSQVELVEYLLAAIKEYDFKFLLVACKDVLDIAKKKGWN